MPDIQTAPQDHSTARRFRGINQWMQPGELAPGDLVDAQNVLVRGTEIVSRPGRQGVLTTPHAAPVYLLGSYRNPDGGTGLLYTSGGKVYSLAKSAAGVLNPAPTEIKTLAGASLSINSASAIGCRLGKFFYFSDGQFGSPLYRTDLSSAAATIGLTAPAAAPGAALTSTLIDSLLGTWTPDSLSGPGLTNRLPNANFSAGFSGWTIFAGDPDFYGSGQRYAGPDGNGESGVWLLLDNPGEGIVSAAALANDPISGDPSRYASQFYAALTLFQSDPAGIATVKVGLLAYADTAGTNLITEQTREFAVPFTGNNAHVTQDTLFSFASLPVPVLSYRIRLSGGAKNPLGDRSIFVQQPVCFPFAAASAQVAGSQIEVSQPQQLTFSGGVNTVSSPGTLGFGKGAGGLHLVRDYGAGNSQNWAAYAAVALGLGKAAGITGLSLSLSFRQDGSGTRYSTNTFTISPDGSTATCDISTVPAAVRGAFRYVEIIFGGDFTTPASSGSDILLFGPLTGAGNLSVGYSDYSYLYTEVNAATDPINLVDVVESNPSPASGAQTATVLKAEVGITLPAAPVNPSATHFAVYRYGGVFQDYPAVARLVAVVPIGADVAAGADARNPNYSWSRTAHLLTDNTPDSFLLSPGVFPQAATAMVNGRDLPPLGISALCAYHGRLYAAVGSVVSVSWLSVPTNPSALYFTRTQITGDPNAEIKGATLTAGGAFDNDPVMALVPTNTAVVVEKQTAKLLLQGFNGLTLNMQDYLKGTGVGCLGIRAACLLQNREIALGTSGVFGFNVAEVAPLSQPIEALLRPKGYDGLPALSPAALSAAAMQEWDRRLLLSCPAAAGDAQNTVTYVYDDRTGGWTRWMFGATSFATLSSATDSGDCFLGGYDGMVYQLAGNADRAAAAGPLLPISVSVTTRGFGQENDQYFWTQDEMSYLSALLTVPANTSIVFSTGNDTGLTQASPGQIVAAGTQTLVRVKAGNLRGLYLTITLSAAVIGLFKLTAIRAEIAEGRRATSA